ncbi:MAG: NUDIX domain-containing protein [Anaerovoracaceae bacterium]|jgi:8-oxo-dGTP diphosphatase
MWKGGVRVILTDEKNRILMVCQNHEGKKIWMVPGGGIEEGENSLEAAKREMVEETGLQVEISELIWHVEEVSPERGQRFVNFFLAEQVGGEARLGEDPELNSDQQVLVELDYFTREEIEKLPLVYPEYLRDELWDILEGRQNPGTYKIRNSDFTNIHERRE